MSEGSRMTTAMTQELAPAINTLSVESTTLDDRRGIYDILLTSGIFNQSDAECVDQMFGEAFTKPGDVQRHAALEHVRLIVIYTSSTDKYGPARRLYESMGFTRTAVVSGYYAENDDLFIYTQRLARKE
jgi:hypothetical protein